MKPHIIVMLTHNDKTVAEAKTTFDSCKDLPVSLWGFKNVGLPEVKMRELVEDMKEAHKETCLEVVTYTEEECLRGAKLAHELGFDYLMGTRFYDSVYEYLKDTRIKFLPFCGKVSGSPSVLEGSIPEIIEDAKLLLEKDVFGIDLLAFRHRYGSDLAQFFCAAISKPVVIAGSVDSPKRIDLIKKMDPWGFTMGTPLFERKFVPDGTFRDNLKWVLGYLNRH